MTQDLLSNKKRAKKAILEAADITVNVGLLLYNPNITAKELEVLSLTLKDVSSACDEASKALVLIYEISEMDANA